MITSGRIHGQGDARVLEAVSTLFELKDRGVVRRVGVSGYPLVTLLRIAHLVLHQLGRPLDLLMSYSHATLQNALYPQTLDLFRAAGVAQLVNASPLSMGLLRNAGPPAWHPAPPALRRACIEASEALGESGTTLERVALGFALRAGVPTAVGFSTPDEVLECADAYTSGSSKENEDLVAQIFERSGFLGWSWASPPA